MKSAKKAFVISDLHMFCRRSDWLKHLPALYEAAASADLFVFNGDTFDFKWSDLSSLEETVDKAIGFLRTFAQLHPQCRVHVNLGNHDHNQPFMEALAALSREMQNFTWHPYYLRVGKTVFLHGDAATYKMTHARLERYRNRWRRHRKQGQIKNRAYDAAFRANAHVAVSRLVFSRKRTARFLAAYLDDIGQGAEDGVERVYYGHTHVPVAGYSYRGLTFHNGGAALAGMDFELVRAAV